MYCGDDFLWSIPESAVCYECMSTICILLFVMFSFAAESFFRYLSILVEDVRLLVKRIRGDISKEELIHKLEGEELDR